MYVNERTHTHRMCFGARIFTASFRLLPAMSCERQHRSWAVAGEWQLARWSSDHGRDGVETLADGSVTAALTSRHAAWRVSYLEAGFDLQLLTQNRIGDERDLGWCFQFGELIAEGMNAGSRGQYAVGIRMQHVSNRSRNAQADGLTFVQGVLRYRF